MVDSTYLHDQGEPDSTAPPQQSTQLQQVQGENHCGDGNHANRPAPQLRHVVVVVVAGFMCVWVWVG